MIDRIGQYRIEKQIGIGGMGLVYLGVHALIGRRAAIKTLLPKHSINPAVVERFFNEARAASAIADPGVVQIYDFGYHVDGTAYIVMELLEGEPLSARIQRAGRLSITDALRIARQGAGSLGAAHACGVVHRDLKPENIYLVRDAEALGGERTKILDFGICKLGDGGSASKLTEVGTTIGTPPYMSPEQCRGDGLVDHRSDIYAFGCLMFEMLTGRVLFDAETPVDFLVAHLREDPPAPSEYVADLPPAIDALVLRCLAKLPDARFQSMAELQAAIGEVAQQLGLVAIGTSSSSETLDMEAPAPESVSLRREHTPIAHAAVDRESIEPVTPPSRARAAIAWLLCACALAGVIVTYLLFVTGDASGRAAAATERAMTGAKPAAIAVTPVESPPPKPAVVPDAAPVGPSKTTTPPPRRQPVSSNEDLYETR